MTHFQITYVTYPDCIIVRCHGWHASKSSFFAVYFDFGVDIIRKIFLAIAKEILVQSVANQISSDDTQRRGSRCRAEQGHTYIIWWSAGTPMYGRGTGRFPTACHTQNVCSRQGDVIVVQWHSRVIEVCECTSTRFSEPPRQNVFTLYSVQGSYRCSDTSLPRSAFRMRFRRV